MRRKAYDKLMTWLKNEDRKPLIVSGARQIGKTYLIDNFCKTNVKNYIHFDFINNPDQLKISNIDDTDTMVETLQITYNFRFDDKDTIIFFDEIQEAPNLIKNLKYLKIKFPHAKIICSGFLLGVRYKTMNISFPVGYVETLEMHQMDFEEFLMATGNERFIDLIKESYDSNKAIEQTLHEILLKLYNRYLLLGGMPELIKNYVDNSQDLSKTNFNILKDIINIYKQDMIKYAISPNESIRIQRIYENIIPQLSKENPKFTYAKLDEKDNRKSDYIVALDWLVVSSIIYKVDQVSKPEFPLKAYQNDEAYKLYANDCGILCMLAEIKQADIILDGDYSFKGKIAENYVLQQLKANDLTLNYYSEKNKGNDAMEIDFLIQLNNNIYPIEVKAGNDTLSKSLNSYMKKFNCKYGIRISTKNFGFENNIKSIPLYATFCIK